MMSKKLSLTYVTISLVMGLTVSLMLDSFGLFTMWCVGTIMTVAMDR